MVGREAHQNRRRRRLTSKRRLDVLTSIYFPLKLFPNLSPCKVLIGINCPLSVFTMSERRRSKGNTNNPNHYNKRSVGDYYKNVYKRTGERPMDKDEDNANGEGTSQRKRRLTRPPNLKGREIGMFYRDLYMNQKKKPISTIVLSQRRKQQIQSLLNENQLNMNSLGVKYENMEESNFKRNFLKKRTGNLQQILHETNIKVEPNDDINEDLFDKFMRKKEDPRYKAMLRQRMKLPSYASREKLLEIIESNQVTVISGETGCGKTTQVSQFILDDYLEKKKGSMCKIICTQPRRISAISVAERVADERIEKLGESTGYHIRLEKVFPRSKGSICFCTTGVILKIMEDDPRLNGVSHLILDEIHERDVSSDFLITIIRDVIKKRKDLKVILMSATLNSEAFSRYFDNCPHINIPGFTYPVKEYYLEDVIEMTRFTIPDHRRKLYRDEKKNFKEFTSMIEPYVSTLKMGGKYSKHTCTQLAKIDSEELNLDLIFELILHICQKEKDEGAILVFLPGYMDISNLNKLLEKSKSFPSSQYLIFPLHSQMPTVEQKQIFRPAPPGMRKIILSTNIAETSITIDDVVYVIDSGRIKMGNFNTEFNQHTLFAEWVSKANANQRRGRAGRVKPGVCYHLFTKVREARLEQFQAPEVLRKRLEEVVLQAKMLQLGKASDFLSKLMDPPPEQTIKHSLELLNSLNALDDEECLTPLGYHLAKLPVGPQMGKMMLLGAMFSCLNPILSIAATLGFKDAFQLVLSKEKEVDKKKLELSNGLQSDHWVYFRALEIFETTYQQRQFCWEYFLSFSTLKLLQQMKKDFMRHLHEMKFVDSLDPRAPECNVNSGNISLVKAIICAGLYPNVGVQHRRKRYTVLRTLERKKVSFHPKSILSKISDLDSPLFVYYLKVKSTKDFVHEATMVYPLPVVFFGDKFEITKNNDNQNIIKIRSFLSFACAEDTALLIKELKDKLNWVLEHKISHPGYVNWAQDSHEIHILRAIMELITCEDIGEFNSEMFDDEDD